MKYVFVVQVELDIDGGGTTAWEDIACFGNLNKALDLKSQMDDILREIKTNHDEPKYHRCEIVQMSVITTKSKVTLEIEKKNDWGHLIVTVPVKRKKEIKPNLTS